MGGGSLTQQGIGAATLTLSGANTFTGKTAIKNGEILLLGGSLVGRVTIANGATLGVNGGSIAGTVTGDGTTGSTLLVSGNYTPSITISNVGTMNITGGTFTVAKAITGASSIAIGAGSALTLNSGGSLTGNISGTGTLTLNTNFMPPGTFSTGTLNVNNNATFTMNNPITVTNQLNVNNGGKFNFYDDISGGGIVTNAGTITVLEDPTITGNFVQNNTGILNIQLQDYQHFSQIVVTGTTILNGGTINISLPNGSGGILDGEVFNVITSNGGVTNNALPTLVYPSSFLLSFTESVIGNNLAIKAVRVLLSTIDPNPEWANLANLLDQLRTVPNSPLTDIFSILDAEVTKTGVDNILSALAPLDVADEGVLMTTFNQAKLPYNVIGSRLDNYRTGTAYAVASNGGVYSKSGYAAGDMLDGYASYGPMLFGNSIHQKSRNNIIGYSSFTRGFGIMADAPIGQFYRVGAAIGYANSAIKQQDNTGNTTNVNTV